MLRVQGDRMDILVIVGCDLSVNSSANLCHKAYIQGLLNCGCAVDLLTVAGKDSDQYHTEELREYAYPMKSLYGSLAERHAGQADGGTSKDAKASSGGQQQNAGGLLYKIKRMIHAMYGPYEVYIAWKRAAMHFRTDKEYDLVLSVSFPPVSHHLARELIRKKHIKTSHWIQIWEDPWSQDLVFRSLNEEKIITRAQQEEASLLDSAERVLYVSPITLAHQQELFPEAAHKMFWLPVPTYYINEEKMTTAAENRYGYFGDYAAQIRNLMPFYQAALQENCIVNICGGSDQMLESRDRITVRPRISLDELRPIEDQTNVLVFLCNLRGGQIPGKIYQYSATLKTILFILDGTDEEQKVLRDYFGRFHRYVFCENTVEDISRAIRDIERGDLHGAVNRPLDCFSPEKIVSEILKEAEEH